MQKQSDFLKIKLHFVLYYKKGDKKTGTAFTNSAFTSSWLNV